MRPHEHQDCPGCEDERAENLATLKSSEAQDDREYRSLVKQNDALRAKLSKMQAVVDAARKTPIVSLGLLEALAKLDKE